VFFETSGNLELPELMGKGNIIRQVFSQTVIKSIVKLKYRSLTRGKGTAVCLIPIVPTANWLPRRGPKFVFTRVNRDFRWYLIE